MAGMAKSIKVVRAGVGQGQPVMVIDGNEFPYFTVDGYHLNVTREGCPCVTLSIAAERVEVIDAISGNFGLGVAPRDAALSLAGVEAQVS